MTHSVRRTSLRRQTPNPPATTSASPAGSAKAGEILDIGVLDHIVIGHQRWFALARRDALINRDLVVDSRDDRSKVLTVGRAKARVITVLGGNQGASTAGPVPRIPAPASLYSHGH